MSPLSSSRRYTQSPIESETGSFSHGVRRKKLLFTAHVGPAPVSLTRKPPVGFATTLIQGAGGRSSPSSRISYSPRELKPPSPLKCARSTESRSDTGSSDQRVSGAVDPDPRDGLEQCCVLFTKRVSRSDEHALGTIEYAAPVRCCDDRYDVVVKLPVIGSRGAEDHEIGADSSGAPVPVHVEQLNDTIYILPRRHGCQNDWPFTGQAKVEEVGSSRQALKVVRQASRGPHTI